MIMRRNPAGVLPSRPEPIPGDPFSGEKGAAVSDDGGYALVFTAMMLVPLVIAASFAVDVGAWYAQASRTQRAADAAALAGAVWLPRVDLATTASNDALSRNWYGSGTAPQCGSSTVTCTSNNGQWSVSVRSTAPRYFSTVVSSQPMSVGRAATAEFNKPIPLGSPLASFANNLPNSCVPSPGVQPTGTCSMDANGNPLPYLWAAINAPYMRHADGDPLTTRCWGNSGGENSCASSLDASGSNPTYTGSMQYYNPQYSPNGYLYAVEVPTSGTVSVQIFDASCNASSIAGDQAAGDCSSDTGTAFEIYDWSSPYQITATTLMPTSSCTSGTPRSLLATPNTAALTNVWTTLCTFSAAPGVYPVRVKNDNINIGSTVCTYTTVDVGDGCVGDAMNSYAIRATGVSNIRVYAIDYMSIYTNVGSATSQFHLGELQDSSTNRGKTLQVDMYDPGDGSSGQYTMTVKMPPLDAGASTALRDIPCTWNESQLQGGTSTSTGSPSPACSIITRTSAGVSPFNGQWLRVTITVPTTYSCTTDCWWRVQYAFTSGQPTDRTVWSMRLIGNPVHLV